MAIRNIIQVGDETLRKKFDKIDAELNKRALVNFRKIIEVHPEIIPLLKLRRGIFTQI